MLKIIGISGSLRRDSFNTALLRAASALMPEGAELSVRTINGIPLYDGDAEAASGVPAVVSELKEAVAAADGLLLATPEYNNSIPGVLKNAIDWMSRPQSDLKRVFGGKPVAVIGATPGGFGTILSQNAWLPVLRYLGTRPWCEGRLLVSRASNLFDASGAMTDQKVQEQLEQFLQGFVAFIGSADLNKSRKQS
jgi:chromate reductase, NAD(P)H dehydrogenase (quinone)